MAHACQRLPFEKEIYEMEDAAGPAGGRANGQVGGSEEVRRIRRELVGLKRKIYSNLTAWETVAGRPPSANGRRRSTTST